MFTTSHQISVNVPSVFAILIQILLVFYKKTILVDVKHDVVRQLEELEIAKRKITQASNG